MQNLQIWQAVSILAWLGLAVGAYFYLKKAKNDGTEEAQGQSNKTLRDLVEDQNKKLVWQTNKIEELEEHIKGIKKRLDSYETENNTLREILQGRDKATQEYQAEARATFKKADQIFEIVATTHKDVERLYKAIERHLANQEKRQRVMATIEPIDQPFQDLKAAEKLDK